MNRTFWVTLGAIGGIVAYRRGARAVHRAQELGPLGSAQVAAQATSTLADRAARGLGRLRQLQERRAGRLVIGTAQDATADAAVAPGSGGADAAPATSTIPRGWVPVPAARRSHLKGGA